MFMCWFKFIFTFLLGGTMGAGATLLCCWLAGMEKGSILLSCAGLLVALLSAIGTLGAVIVALFRTEILNLLNPERCCATLAYDSDFHECLDVDETQNMVARYYECALKVKNTGNREIEQFQILVSNARFVPRDGIERPQELKIKKESLFWQHRDTLCVSILKQSERIMPVFRIYGDSAASTPDGCSKLQKPMSVMGVEMPRETLNGKWIIEYQLRSRHGLMKKYRLTIDWSGNWKPRKSEMKNYLNINLEEI